MQRRCKIYTPAEDTFLLDDCIRWYSGEWALEIGVGSGSLLCILEKNFQNVVGSDICLPALVYCKSRSNAMLACCDAASAFVAKFDLVISNPPYLPNDYGDDKYYPIKDSTVHGGPNGIETTIHFIRSALPLLAKHGKMLFVISSLANSTELDRLLATEIKMSKKVIMQKRLFYETLWVMGLSL